MTPQQSEPSVWARSKTLKRSRTVCDLSVLMQQCNEDETRNRDQIHASAARRIIDSSRKCRRPNTTGEPTKPQSTEYALRNMKCPFFEASPIEKHDSNAFTGDRSLIYNSHQNNLETGIWERFTFLCIGEQQLLFKNNLKMAPSSQTLPDEKCIDRLVDIIQK